MRHGEGQRRAHAARAVPTFVKTVQWVPTLLYVSRSQQIIICPCPACSLSPDVANRKPWQQQIDDLRRERVLFDTIYKKMERELSDRKKMMANVIEVSRQLPSKAPGGRVLSVLLWE